MCFLDAIQAFALVGIAELGDKSQLVCLALAARHGPAPIALGAALAFGLLNGVACAVGAGVGEMLPEFWVSLGAAALFLLFGVKTLLEGEDEDEDEAPTRALHPVFLAFWLLFLAEFGDKTQITVLGLASTRSAMATWLGATVALTLTSAVAAWAGRWLNTWLSPSILRRVTGGLFLLFSALFVWDALA